MFQSSKHKINKMVIITLTHWGRVTHICVGELTIICSDNGLSPGRRQAIIWTNAGILLIVPLGTNFSEISIGIQTFSFKKLHLKMSSAKWRPFCLGLNVLNENCVIHICWKYLLVLTSNQGLFHLWLFTCLVFTQSLAIKLLQCFSTCHSTAVASCRWLSARLG